jgi:dethiobiotin synthase
MIGHQRWFVTGTGTEVGKTVACGVLCLGLDAQYWKPIQAGSAPPTDSMRLASWIGVRRVFPERFTLDQAASPDQAAAAMGIHLALEDFSPPICHRLLVEGAGGLLVPLNERQVMLDLARHLAAGIILVAGSQLGTLNHTMLSAEALLARSQDVRGWLLCGDHHQANQRYLEQRLPWPLLGRIPLLSNLNRQALEQVSTQYFAESWRTQLLGADSQSI